MERTVVLIKPDAMKKKIIGKIIDRFERENLKIVGLKIVKLTQELLETWYAHHINKPFFKDLAEYMKSSPIVAIALEGTNAVVHVRNIVGPTDSRTASPDTIRGQFGEDIQRNVVHASDASERAEFEISLLFKKEEIFS